MQNNAKQADIYAASITEPTAISMSASEETTPVATQAGKSG